MQLDHTRIAIRPRGMWETLDLSLRVTCIYAPALFVSVAVVAVPFAILNFFALQWIVADEYSGETISRYVWLMTLCVFLEAPLATVPATQVLGRAMFLQEISWRAIAKDIQSLAARLVWTQGIVRGGLLAVVLIFLLRDSIDVSQVEVGLILLAIASWFLRAARPFLNEIVLLERSPLRRLSSRSITVGRRSRALHGPSTGDLVSRAISTTITCAMLVTILTLNAWLVYGAVTNQWVLDYATVQIFLPLSMWIVVTFATVVKFLSYLDLRIRREGWEVELLVRAAAHDLQGEVQ